MQKKLKITLISLGMIVLLGLGGSVIYLYEPFYTSDITISTAFSIFGEEVNDFTYLLQYDQYDDRNQAVSAISNTKYDLIILDYYFDDTPWTLSEINTIQSNDDAKIVVSYISIGEAESYRPYWQSSWDANEDGIPDEDAPNWLDVENSDWEGNYKVKYWDLAWQNLIFGNESAYLDQIIAAGFNGAYLDIIDAFEYYQDQGDAEAPQKMVDFVVNLSAYCKAKNPDFLIIPQNGEALGEYGEYLEAIDGIGREDVFFEDNWKKSSEEIEYTKYFLSLFLEDQKFVLNIEYPTFPRFIHQVYRTADENGYLCYVGPRDLDSIQLNKGFLPT